MNVLLLLLLQGGGGGVGRWVVKTGLAVEVWKTADKSKPDHLP